MRKLFFCALFMVGSVFAGPAVPDLFSCADGTVVKKREQWETKQHQQIHIEQPHMALLREFKGDFITDTVLGEVALL